MTILIEVPEELEKSVKIEARRQGVTPQEWVTASIRQWVRASAEPINTLPAKPNELNAMLPLVVDGGSGLAPGVTWGDIEKLREWVYDRDDQS